jgi:ElaB/YqjD/DUF883 family membrane-anchored ribosome-binding protein
MSGRNDGIVLRGNGNIKATQIVVGNHATGTMTTAASPGDKADLESLLQRLAELLAKSPSAGGDEAEALTLQARQLVEVASKEAPNPSLLKVIGSGLKQTAAFLKDSAPAAVETAGQIVSLVAKLHGVGL